MLTSSHPWGLVMIHILHVTHALGTRFHCIKCNPVHESDLLRKLTCWQDAQLPSKTPKPAPVMKCLIPVSVFYLGKEHIFSHMHVVFLNNNVKWSAVSDLSSDSFVDRVKIPSSKWKRKWWYSQVHQRVVCPAVLHIKTKKSYSLCRDNCHRCYWSYHNDKNYIEVVRSWLLILSLLLLLLLSLPL